LTFREVLNTGRVLVGDGAMGTELEKRKRSKEACPELLSIIEPEMVQSIHRDYFEAGSDLVQTNTFGANRIRLGLYGQGHRVQELILQSVQLARDVCPAGKFVAGSVGPTGDLPEPYGTLSHGAGVEVFHESIAALVEAGVDVLIIETMMSLEEAAMAVEAAKQYPQIPTILTMTFEVNNHRIATAFGVKPEDLVTKGVFWGLDGIGANCGQGFTEMTQVVQALRGGLPILAQANAGMPIMEGTQLTYPDQPETIRPKVETLVRSDVRIIGGCCGTDSHFIRMVRRVVDEYNND